MKDKPARALAIIALVFMVIFLASFTATLVDYTLLGGGIGVVTGCSGIIVLVMFIVLKADGRGFSLTEMKNESEMKKIEQALKDQEEQEKAASENGVEVLEACDNAETNGAEVSDEAIVNTTDTDNVSE